MSTNNSKKEENTTENLKQQSKQSPMQQKNETENVSRETGKIIPSLVLPGEMQDNEVELHLYHTGTAAIFYKPKMTEEQFKLAMQINSLLQRAYKKGMRFKFTMDIQLQLNLPL